jgi:hypothetical protein
MNTNVLNPFIEQLAECLTAEAAQKIVSMEAKDDLQCRVNSLASTANAGKLTQDEQSEYDRILAAFHFVTILQARVRLLLKA